MQPLKGRYEPLGPVGHGAQGEVIKARDSLHNRSVAIKIRPFSGSEDREAVLREGRVLLGLKPHLNIPLIRDDFIDGSNYFLVMDWVEGVTLLDMIERQGPLHFDDAIDYMSQVASAVDHLHTHNPPLIHRDIKPSNVIVTSDGHAVLVDFGIASAERASHRMGSRGYVAPEIAVGDDATTRSDIYSFSATLFALLSGAAPRPGHIPDWRHVAPGAINSLERALARGLAFDPSRRPVTAAELLESIRDDRPVPNNLPLRISTLFGREDEVAQAHADVMRTRIVSFVGPGGVGKTRLALETASRMMPTFPDGSWFVELADETETTLTGAIAKILGIDEPSGDIVEAIARYLMDRRVLLILDNCERVIAKAGQVTKVLAERCKDVHVLVTSREPLGVDGEHVRRLQPLAVASEGAGLEAIKRSPAVQLFVDRAQHASPEFELNDETASSVLEVCRALDGIPLAIELAASRIYALSATDIASRLSDRLNLVAGKEGARPSRQQSLRATLDWTYEMLKPDEALLFTRLGAFSGGAHIDAIEAVTSIPRTIDHVLSLVDRSLLIAEHSAKGTRYKMLETVHAYAQEKLRSSADGPSIRDAHMHFYRQLAEDAEGGLGGADQRAILEMLGTEHPNLRVALAWGAETSSVVGLKIAASLWRFWEVRGFSREGLSWLTNLLDRCAGCPPQDRARALRAAGGLALTLGLYGEAESRLEEAVGIANELGDEPLEGASLNALAAAAGSQGNLDTERKLYEEALKIWRKLGHNRGIAVTVGNLGTSALERGDLVAAKRYFQESLDIRTTQGDEHGIAAALNGLGLVLQREGDLAAAGLHFEQAASLWGKLGYERGAAIVASNTAVNALLESDLGSARGLFMESIQTLSNLDAKWDLAEAIHGLGETERLAGQLLSARNHHAEALRIRRDIGDKKGVAEGLYASALIASERGDDKLAARLLGAADAIREQVGAVLPVHQLSRDPSWRELLRERLGKESFDALVEQGRELDPSSAASEALRST